MLTLLAAATAWTLLWHDEFDGPDGSVPDPQKWGIEVNSDGGGNHELQYYTARRSNVEVRGGELVITARQERYTGRDGVTRAYTSGRLNTSGVFMPRYGRYEARMRIPRGQGMWPAFWLLGADITQKGWPDCGEIDIMENIGKEPATIHGTIHGPGYSGDKGPSSSFSLPSGAFADGYHVFAADWSPNRIDFFVDGHRYATRTPKDLPPGKPWVYDHPFFLLLNLAVGGDWPGPPDGQTMFPHELRVDYVRVWQRPGDANPHERDAAPAEPRVSRLGVPRPAMQWQPATVEEPRPAKIDTIVLHHTVIPEPAARTAGFFARPDTAVSAHFVVGGDGTIIQCVPVARLAHHAGISLYKGREHVNDFSIGIEIVNLGDGKDPYPDAQYRALGRLMAYLMTEHGVGWDRVTGHKNVARPIGRKDDPSPNFDYRRLHAETLKALAEAHVRAGAIPGKLDPEIEQNLTPHL